MADRQSSNLSGVSIEEHIVDDYQPVCSQLLHLTEFQVIGPREIRHIRTRKNSRQALLSLLERYSVADLVMTLP